MDTCGWMYVDVDDEPKSCQLDTIFSFLLAAVLEKGKDKKRIGQVRWYRVPCARDSRKEARGRRSAGVLTDCRR